MRIQPQPKPGRLQSVQQASSLHCMLIIVVIGAIFNASGLFGMFDQPRLAGAVAHQPTAAEHRAL